MVVSSLIHYLAKSLRVETMGIQKLGKVSVVLLNYNGMSAKYKDTPILQTVLQGLKKTKYDNLDIIMADCSTDDSKSFVKKNYPNIKLFDVEKGHIQADWNLCIPYALNKGAKYILLLNTDIEVTDVNWLKKLVVEIDKDKKIGIEGCKLIYPDGRIQHAGLEMNTLLPYNIGRAETDNGQYDYIKELGAVTFACVLITAECAKTIKFDEKFALGYDDTDYCIQATNAGFKVLYNGKVQLTHLENFTLSNSQDTSQKDNKFYLVQLSGAYFIFKNYKITKAIPAILMQTAGSFITVEGKGTTRMSKIKFEDKALHKLRLAFKADLAGFRLSRSG